MAKKVCIIIASESDKDIGDKAVEVLEKFNVPYQYEQASAHRNPKKVEEIVQSTDADVFITVAGLAGALPGFVASITNKPVIGVPKDVKLLGLDALFSMVQMPPGIPVATVGIDNGKNAGYLAIRILGIKYPEVLGAEETFSRSASSSSSRSYSSAPIQGKAVLESFKFEPPVLSLSEDGRGALPPVVEGGRFHTSSLNAVPEQPLPSLAAFPLFASEPSSAPTSIVSTPTPQISPQLQAASRKPQTESVFGDWGIPDPKKKEPPKGDWFRY
ncbi:TPA: 5-(carboxyamino)imidazole ribonucleotide mutase [archaeon]|nr:5-(carboxyamino)imidazole ribonucleotide mutase [Candidatus Naiadarchaeales archaeon SRR2090159.bin1288]